MRLLVLIGIFIITVFFAIFTNIKAHVLHNKKIKKDRCERIQREEVNIQNETCSEFPYYSSDQSECNFNEKEKQYYMPSKHSANFKKLCGTYAIPSYN